MEQRGLAVFNNWCDACHRNSERNAPGTASLAFKYRGELPAALEERDDLTAELVAFYVRNGIATMPFFRPTEISDDDLGALAEYLVKP
jgi:mono/diheme cytochrome c family protein